MKSWFVKFYFTLSLLGFGCSEEYDAPVFEAENQVSNYPCDPEGSMMGIDLSQHNGTINWEKLTSSHPEIKFIYLRSTVGYKQDSRYLEYLKSAQKHEIPTGAYHYYWPNRSVTQQFKNFRDHMNLNNHQLIPVLDVEKPSLKGAEHLRRGIYTWLKLVEAEYGVKPMIYTNMAFYNEYLKGYFNEYPKWIAAYSRCPESIDWTIHQFSETGILDGISRAVDLNYCPFGLLDTLMVKCHD